MSSFTALEREHMFIQATTDKLDIIVIGGGITGAGIALDAAARGLRVALFEMQDFASGTSSRSTKLIHGGLRYLKQLEFKVVAEVGKERAIVYENGPHITTPVWMLLPLYKDGTFGKLSTMAGLTLYDFLAGVKKNERKSMLSVEQTLKKEPLLRTDGLVGGGYYVEYKTDDARLTIEVMKKAVELGANALNYAKVARLLYEAGKVVGVIVIDELTGHEYEVFAKQVINAAGPWVDDIRELDQSKEGKTLLLTKGVHLVFNASVFPLQQAVYFDTPDGRMCFAIPREGKTYFGTTDTVYEGDKANPTINEGDKLYLLEAANAIFPSLKLQLSHIEASYAGLRPLIHQEGKSTSEVSRKDELFISESGLLSIAGGKLTGYRKMAEAVVTKALKLMKSESKHSTKINTKQIAVSGGDVGGSVNFDQYIKDTAQKGVQQGLKLEVAERLVRKYGSNAKVLFSFMDKAKAYATQYEIDESEVFPLLYAINYEMVTHLDDYLVRRVAYTLFQAQKVESLIRPVCDIMGDELGWDESRRSKEITNFWKGQL